MFFLILSMLSVLTSAQAGISSTAIADAFLSEQLVYKLGIWFLDDVARGKIELRKAQGDEYLATLSTSISSGMAAKLLRNRKDVYVARLKLIELADHSKRFITKSLEKTITMTGKSQRSLVTLDHDKHLIMQQQWKNGVQTKNEVLPLPKDVFCDDPLAAIYNFRLGAYGPIEAGREYIIYGFPKPGRLPETSIRVVADVGMERQGRLLARIHLGEDSSSAGGELEIQFASHEMSPLDATIKGVPVFGDMRARRVEAN